ncbi:MAG: hypothetical protein AAB538_05805 [Patescibacteria group bacterium]|mgnify:CR=1 FL=1
MAEEFKPNIYPIIYWALAYGVIAGFLLFLVYLLSRYITVVWFPVFAVGLIWGAYRNYRKQKRVWSQASGVPLAAKPPLQEFRDAISDVVDASRDMVAQQRAEDEAIASEVAEAEADAIEEEAAYARGFRREIESQRSTETTPPPPPPPAAA